MTHYERSGDDIDRGLVGYWRLNDLRVPSATTSIDRAKFNDAAHSGTLANTDGVNGLNPDATNFDGIDGFMNIGTPAILDFIPDADEFTISVWAKTSGSSGNIFSKREAASTNSQYAMLMQTTKLKAFTGGVTWDSDVVINDGEWHHLVIVNENVGGTLMSFGYVDAVMPAAAVTSGSFTTSEDVLIGARSGPAILLAGDMQNIRVYNRALTHGEVSKLFRLKL